ncbi:ABC transporter permease [Roseibium sp. M-1]
MLSLILNRLAHSIVVLLAVALISFSMVAFLGDPVSNMVGQDTTVAERAALRESLGLNDPFPIRFARFVGNAARGDFGLSYSLRVPVSELFAERMPATLELSIISALFALAIGIPLGIHTALHRDSIATQTVLTTSLIGVSLPTFLIGVLLILIFGVSLQWLPTFGRGEVVSVGGWTTGLLTVSGLHSLVLPVATLTIFQLTLIIRLVRAEMMEVLHTDFIKFARARGIRRRSLIYRHALKNTMMPVITVVGLQLGNIIAFSLITESVFQWPGMGLLFIQAIGNADIPVVVAYLMIIALIFVLINLIVDLLHFALDPRLQSSGAK